MIRSLTRNTCGCGICKVCLKFKANEHREATKNAWAKRHHVLKLAKSAIPETLIHTLVGHPKRCKIIKKIAKHRNISYRAIYNWMDRNSRVWRRFKLSHRGF